MASELQIELSMPFGCSSPELLGLELAQAHLLGLEVGTRGSI